MQAVESVYVNNRNPCFDHSTHSEMIDTTTALLSLIAYLSNDDIQHTIMAETPLFHHVSTYFNSGDIQIAQLGAVRKRKNLCHPSSFFNLYLLDR